MKLKYAFLLSAILVGLTLCGGFYGVLHESSLYGFQYEKTIIINGQQTVEIVNLWTSIFADLFLAFLFVLQVQAFFLAEDLERKTE